MSDSSKDKHLVWIEKITDLMDSAFKIPGTNIRFGWDPIIGLIPGLGEITTFGISASMIVSMAQRGVSPKVLAMMVGNIIVDTIVGAIPFVGDLLDFGLKANRRNLKLLKKHQNEGKYQGSATGVIALTLIVLFLLLIGIGYALWKIFGLLSNISI